MMVSLAHMLNKRVRVNSILIGTVITAGYESAGITPEMQERMMHPDNLIGPLLERWLADAGFAVMVVAHHHGRLAVTADAIVANVTTRRQALILARSQQAPGGAAPGGRIGS